jgi:hypothetical protein
MIREDRTTMSEPVSSATGLPAWVYKRDGRLVPFEADKISRSLFAATESLGQANAFLARELTDGILHFLAAECEGIAPTTSQIADLVTKVVRELGQPALAQAFADGGRLRLVRGEGNETEEPAPESIQATFHYSPLEPLPAILTGCRRDFTLRTVFTRDLVAAQADGLLTLTGLDSPLELASCVLGSPDAQREPHRLLEALEQVRTLAGRFIALDGPEYLLAQEPSFADAARRYARELACGLRLSGLSAVVNLNGCAPPRWADDLAEGPLFAGQRHTWDSQRLDAIRDLLLEQLLPAEAERVRVDWHLGERDFRPDTNEGHAERLTCLARWALETPALTFVLDRPRRPLPLAEGLDRRHSSVLLSVGLHLPFLAEMPRVRHDPEVFLQKLASLARLALSAALQKRDFLRRHTSSRAALLQGFLLDRARLVVVPVGLDAAVRTLLGRGLCEGKPALELARRVIQGLREILRQDGQAGYLDTCLDGLGTSSFFVNDLARGALSAPALADVAGLTAWDSTAPLRSQLRGSGTLHAAAEMGTAAVLLSPEQPLSAERVLELLRFAWQQTEVVRLRLVRLPQEPRQMTFLTP